jgi:acetyl esterase/lipase
LQGNQGFQKRAGSLPYRHEITLFRSRNHAIHQTLSRVVGPIHSDPLRDDARSYVAKLQDDDVSASWINEPGLVHDYLRARHISRVAGAAFARICSAITRLAG